MSRLVWPALAAIAVSGACGSSVDDRPRDAQYITDTILAPLCGAAECHSTFVQSENVVLDTYEGMRTTIVHFPLVSFDSDDYDPAAPAESSLITWVTQIDPFNLGIGRMPLDAPIPNADVDLLEAWITGPQSKIDDHAACQPGVTACPQLADTCVVPDGATLGECFLISYPSPAEGAACDPAQFSGLACNGLQLVKCTSAWSFGDLVQTCDSSCELGVCS